MDKVRSSLDVVLMVMWDGSVRLLPGSLDQVPIREFQEANFIVVKRPGDHKYVVYKERFDLVKHNSPITCEQMLDIAAKCQQMSALKANTRSALGRFTEE